jgi:hypothetical protein
MTRSPQWIFEERRSRHSDAERPAALSKVDAANRNVMTIHRQFEDINGITSKHRCRNLLNPARVADV